MMSLEQSQEVVLSILNELEISSGRTPLRKCDVFCNRCGNIFHHRIPSGFNKQLENYGFILFCPHDLFD